MDKCPRMEFKKGTLNGDSTPNATFTFKDEKGFYKDLSEAWRIKKI